MLQKLDPHAVVSGVRAGCSSGEGLQAPMEPSSVGQWFGADHGRLHLLFLQFLAGK